MYAQATLHVLGVGTWGGEGADPPLVSSHRVSEPSSQEWPAAGLCSEGEEEVHLTDQVDGAHVAHLASGREDAHVAGRVAEMPLKSNSLAEGKQGAPVHAINVEDATQHVARTEVVGDLVGAFLGSEESG